MYFFPCIVCLFVCVYELCVRSIYLSRAGLESCWCDKILPTIKKKNLDHFHSPFSAEGSFEVILTKKKSHEIYCVIVWTTGQTDRLPYLPEYDLIPWVMYYLWHLKYQSVFSFLIIGVKMTDRQDGEKGEGEGGNRGRQRGCCCRQRSKSVSQSLNPAKYQPPPRYVLTAAHNTAFLPPSLSAPHTHV